MDHHTTEQYTFHFTNVRLIFQNLLFKTAANQLHSQGKHQIPRIHFKSSKLAEWKDTSTESSL
jgi:hypothetical protein